jgi:hypothetical protein
VPTGFDCRHRRRQLSISLRLLNRARSACPGSSFTLSDIVSTNISVSGTTVTPFGLSATFNTAGNPITDQSGLFGCEFFACGTTSSTFAVAVNIQEVLYASAENAVASMHMTAATTATPIAATLPLLASGVGALGLLGWRRKRKNVAAAAA